MFCKIAFLLFISSVKCSRVVDSASQAGVYLSDYCPNTSLCPEGSHVMCMYYNPHKTLGPKCRNARNLTITPELASKLLDVSNAVRSKIARGEETGKNGQLLPRGYGIFRLVGNTIIVDDPYSSFCERKAGVLAVGTYKAVKKWDSELATFAQVLVNQCVLRHDQCRATKRFHNPSQMAGVVRFSVPDWIPKTNFGNFTELGFNNAKLLYAAAQILKSWYRQKSSVTSHELTNYPDWTQRPQNTVGKLYMEMIYGPATHMGCGVSAYTEYAYYDNNTPLYYNSIHIICNFSARPMPGTAVINTVPPGDPHVLNPCGCPAGSVDDKDCLCHEEVRETYPHEDLKEDERSCQPGMNCDPTVVLLPIFTVEDAPLEKLVNVERKFANVTHAGNKGMDITDSLEIFDNNFSEFKHTFRTKIKIPKDTKTESKINWKNSHPKYTRTVKNRHFGPRHEDQHEDKRDAKETRKQLNIHIPRPSVFSKIPRFQLPHNVHTNMYNAKENKIKVVARKDFAEGKQLADKYLYYKDNNIVKPNNKDKFDNRYKVVDSYEVKSVIDIPHSLQNPLVHDIENTKLNPDEILGIDSAEERLINNNENEFNLYTNNVHKPNIKSVTEETDNKLMALLDTLEQEVKHIELRDSEKQLFDAKIRKIYGKVVGRQVDFENSLQNKSEFGFNDIMEKHSSINNFDAFNHANNENVAHIQEVDTNKYAYANERETFDNHQSINSKPDLIDEFVPRSRKFENKNRDFFDNAMTKHLKRTDLNGNKGHKNTLRQRTRNEIHSYEHVNDRHQYDSGDHLDRKSQRRNLLERQSLRKNNEKPNFKVNFRNRGKNNYAVSNELFNEDPLSDDRRKYYQDKLDSLQRSLKNVRSFNHNKAVSIPLVSNKSPPPASNDAECTKICQPNGFPIHARQSKSTA